MNLSIIIPNYNGENLLKKNLPAVYKASRNYHGGNVEIIISDDPSTDNSGEVIRNFITENKDKNIVIKTVSNKLQNKAGFSKNVNRGVGLAGGDILVLLNTDVNPRENFLETLIQHFADKNVFAVGCMDESIEGDQKIFRGRGVGSWQKGFMMHSKGDIDKDNTLWASGGSSAFNRKIWEQIGGLEELYNPYYWEDIDISYRAQKCGYNILFEKKSIVIHEHEKGAIRTISNKSQIKKTAYRNQFIFVWLNITDKDLLFSHFFWLPFHLFSAAIRRDRDFFSGFISAIMKINEIINKRKKYIELFRITDKDILKNFIH